ncbi:up-regulator of cell proliferation [Spea bombifrons]|uniref:up-regulator of cell proliferation n=1 Tax=Spea bombifrons TaxID=233779 RepID=UPI00234BAC7D|nr:up-regulator of cell proliferation [Spea bombifrons]
MDRGLGAARVISSLRWKLTEVFAEDTVGLFDEVSSLLQITHEEYLNGSTTQSRVKRTEWLLTIILEKGDEACEKFLSHVKNMIPRFPALSGLSGYFPENKVKIFDELLDQLGMKARLRSKLELKDVLQIERVNVKDFHPRDLRDIPWHFLKKLMALNRTARNTDCAKSQLCTGQNLDNIENNDLFQFFNIGVENVKSYSVHPLDVLCVLLHCSDGFLQQEIVSKMSMCQFAVPLLLPAGDGVNCTFMLWAMRDLVKRWRPHSLADAKGFLEESVVDIPMPTFSFVRMGKNKLSKSKILNQVLNPAQQYHDFFIHEDLQGGNAERKISDGLVEMSWYFPSGSRSSDIYPEPIAVANLRGELESNVTQFSFLTQVSSAVFIFTENICEREYRMLSNCSNSEAKLYFIITPGPGRNVNAETLQNLKQLMTVLKLKKEDIIFKQSTDNDTVLVQNIQSVINSSLIHHKTTTLENMGERAAGLNIYVDQSLEECRHAREHALKITGEIKDVAQYKKEAMSLQGDLWKQLSKIEKEMCRMKDQGTTDAQMYRSELLRQRISIHEKQHRHSIHNSIMMFIDGIFHLSGKEKHYFLKWMKFELDCVARKKLSSLQAEYKEKINNPKNNQEEIKQLDHRISASSLGIEHFLRELGQLYEAEYSMYKEEKNHIHERQFVHLPGIAADLLLDGFPLELIDGDASNIPLQWITDVLTELDSKTGGRCRLRVITVLGVQSTGKSTLLNTMFGLQFPVASGRCTRGAFMTLIKVEENLQEELGCDFILVIDTEGLKAPELSSLEGSYEHDNELATLVVGLSDITIVNMAMENTTEMKDILQIVVHAFLRMKEVGKKPNCQFVHQNVSDVSAHEKNMRDRRKLLEHLDGMTKAAAKMENKFGITKFSDMMDYDVEKDNWYIPGLWHGVPPMAPVNFGYSENVSELKKYLTEFMKRCKAESTPPNIKDFIEWIKSLWNAVKYEKFIFSFRNSLVAEAYNKLSTQFSQWEWNFTKTVLGWLSETETAVRNQTSVQLNEEMCQSYKDDLRRVLCEGEAQMLEHVQKYFENKTENVQLIERYKEDFLKSVKFLRKELERNALNKCDEAFQIQNSKVKIENIKDEYQKSIETKVSELLERCRKMECQLSKETLEKEFDAMWKKTVSEFQVGSLKKRDISKSILQQLSNNMSNKGSEINKEISKVNSLQEFKQNTLKVNDSHIERSWYAPVVDKLFRKEDYKLSITQLSNTLIDMCKQNVGEKMNTRSDYDDSYSQGLLHLIDEKLQDTDTKKIPFTTKFELDIKMLNLARAAPLFQEMHDRFIQENDPKLSLERLKPQYLSTFQAVYQKKDMSQQKAQSFCDSILAPALTEYIYKCLGEKMVTDVVDGSDTMFNSRSFFQYSVLESLLEKEDFREYVRYISSYRGFLKDWIRQYVCEKYKKSLSLETLQKNILSSVVKKIQAFLANEKCLENNSVSELLKNLCEELKSELVISQSEINAITFENNTEVAQFAGDVRIFVEETEKRILKEAKSWSVEFALFKVTLNPVDVLLEKVIGCGKQCPFCKVPCEAGGKDHTEHKASFHRPEGLGRYRWDSNETLVIDICSTSVVSNNCFKNKDTNCEWHDYKDYKKIYPDWAIQPDDSMQASDYWKYIFNKFNEQFAAEYKAKPAALPWEWKKLSKNDALRSLKGVFNRT